MYHVQRAASSWKKILAAGLLTLGMAACGGGGGGGAGGDGGTDPGGDPGGTSQKVTLSGTVQLAASLTTSQKPRRQPAAVDPSALNSAQNLGGAIVLAVDRYGNAHTTTAAATTGATRDVGDFSFDGLLDSGTAYALIFIDSRTLQVIGSLVVASDTTKVGGLVLSDDTDIGEVVVDAANQFAVVKGDVTGASSHVQDRSSELDANGDGTFGQDDISELQARSLTVTDSTTGTTNESKLANITVVSFLGDPGTWSMSFDRFSFNEQFEDFNFNTGTGCPIIETGGGTEGRLSLRRRAEVPGPSGQAVNAVKDGSMTFYNRSSNQRTPVDASDPNCAGYQGGNFAMSGYYDFDTVGMTDPNDPFFTYFDGYQAGRTALSLPPNDGAVPPNFLEYSFEHGLWAWAEYYYIDIANGAVVFGEREFDPVSGNSRIYWAGDTSGSGEPEGFKLPLDFQPGQRRQIESFSFDVPDPDPTAPAGATVSVSVAMFATVQFAQNADGSPAVMTTALNENLPIIKVSTDIEVTPASFAQFFDEDEGDFYLLAKYGVQVPAEDAQGSPVDWRQAFATSRFGCVANADIPAGVKWCGGSAGAGGVSKGEVRDATPTAIGGVATNADVQPFPSLPGPDGAAPPSNSPDDNSALSLRNDWIRYLSANMAKVDTQNFNSATGGGGGFDAPSYFWVDNRRDHDGDGIIDDAQAYPPSYDRQNYFQKFYEEGSATREVDFDPTTGAVVSGDVGTFASTVAYHDNTPSGVEFRFEFRMWNFASNTSQFLTGASEVLTPVDVNGTCDATAGECVVQLRASTAFTLPDLAAFACDPTAGFDAPPPGGVGQCNWQHWQWNGEADGNPNDYDVYTVNSVELWLVMDDDSDRSNGVIAEQPLEWYTVIDPVKVQTSFKPARH